MFSEELAAVKRNGKWAYIDKEGNEQFEVPYRKVTPFYNGLAEVRVKVTKVSMLGIVLNVFANLAGSMGDYTYRGIDFDFMEDNEKRGYINKQGELVITTKYDFVGVYNSKISEHILVVKNHKVGLVDINGNFVIPAEYDQVTYFKDGYAVVKLDDKHKFVNLSHEVLNKNEYSDARIFQDGMAAVKMGDNWGYIKSDGMTVIRPKFEIANSFYGDRASVKFNGNWRIIDKEGTTVKELVDVVEILDFVNGLAPARKGKNWGFIDINGDFVIEPQFSEASFFEGFEI